MIISVAEGTKLGTSFISSFCASFSKNNQAELLHGFFAETVSWKWTDGSEFENTPSSVLMDVLKAQGKISSHKTHTKPFICVDTENGTIILTFTMIANINCRMDGVSNITMSPATYILTVNNDHKIVRWNGIWNNQDVPKALTKLGLDPPKAEILITSEEGEHFAAKYLQAISDGFLDNSHAVKCRDFVADYVSWDWSDGNKGSGTYNEFHDVLSKSWGSMVASWIPVNPTVVVDRANRVITISYHCVANITGGIIGENNSLQQSHVLLLHLDENHKVFKMDLWWDINDATLQAIVCKITAKLSTANKDKLQAIKSLGEEVMTGQ